MFTQTSQYGQAPLLEGCLEAPPYHLGPWHERKGKVYKWSLIFFSFLSSSHLRCSGLIYRKRKKKAKSGRLPSRYIKVAHWGQLSVTVALPGSAEVVRLEQEGEAGFTLHLAWHAFIKHPVSFLCFSYQESFSWILFLFLFFKSLRRLGGEVIRTGELGYGHKDWRALQDREIYVPKLPISHQPDMAAVCLTRALV